MRGIARVGIVAIVPFALSCDDELSLSVAPRPDASADSTDTLIGHDDTDTPADTDDSGATIDGGIDGGSRAPSVVESPANCSAVRPTWIGGGIFGSDGRALNALIGVDQQDATKNKVDADGVVCGSPGSRCCGGYSFCVSPNPNIDAAGSTDATAIRKWGKCVTSKVVNAFFEVYPKSPAGKTTFTRYGEAVHAYQPITPSKPNAVDLRLPRIFQVEKGNTGGVTGIVTCAGKPVAITDITRVRAWSNAKGPECGIEGYNASATSLVLSGGATRYRIDYLAGGRCNAPSQNYRFYMDVNCGGVKKTMRQEGDIRQGLDTVVDWKF